MHPQAKRAVRFYESEAARELLVGVLLPTISVILLIAVSGSTGPAFDELDRLRAIEDAEGVILSIARDGLSVLSSPTTASYSAEGHGSLLILLGAWAKLSIGRVGLLDLLTSARLPWLALSALAPVLVYATVRASWDQRQALLAGVLLLLTPHWLHSAAVSSLGATLLSLWLLVLAPYVRSLVARGGSTTLRRRSTPLFWSVVTGAAVGFGAAIHLSALWVLPVILVHYWIARLDVLRRIVQRGSLPAPGALVWAAVFVPLMCLLFNPGLWGKPVIAIVRWALGPLAPSFKPAYFAGEWVSSLPAPKTYAITWLSWTLPAALLLCLMIGLLRLIHRGLARRFASGSLRPCRDRAALGALVAVGLTVTLISPGFAPSVLARFPPHAELALPFVAVAAAAGLSLAADRALGVKRASYFCGAVVTLVAWTTLSAPSTLSSSFDALIGGAAAVQERKLLPLSDGSELALLATDIDAIRAQRLVIEAPEVPPSFWSVLRESGRLETSIVSGTAQSSDLVLVRGPSGDGAVIATIERNGAELWTLLR